MTHIQLLKWSAGVAVAAAIACGGDASSPGTPDTPSGSSNAIHVGDTLTRTFRAAARSDTLVLTADKILLFRVDVRELSQTMLVGLPVLGFSVVDPSTSTTIVSGGAALVTGTLGPGVNDPTFDWSRLPHAGTYLLVVTMRSGFTYTGSYQVRLIASVPAPESAPARITLGDSITESIDVPGDIDEFTLVGIKAASPARLFVHARTGNASDTLVVQYVNGPAFVRAPGNDPYSFGASGYVSASLSADSVTIRVRAESWATRGTYTLKLVAVDEAPEGVPAALVAGDTVTSSLEFPGDIDTFTFTGVPGALYALAAQSTSGRAAERLHFELLGSPTTFDVKLSGNTPTLLGQTSGRFQGGVPMKVRVSNDGDQVAYGPYRISIIPINPAPERASPTLVYGDTISESIEFKADFDEFNVAGRAGDTVIVYAQALGTDTTKALTVSLGALAVASPFVSYPSVISFDAIPGRVLLASRTAALVVPSTGTFKVSVNLFSPAFGDSYTGPYRLVVGKISGAPESVSPLVPLNTVVIEAGDPPGDLDRFLLQGTAGQQVAIYTSPVPSGLPGSPSPTFGFWNGSAPAVMGLASDSLGWNGTGRLTLNSGSWPILVEANAARGRPFQYRLWAYLVDTRPERVSPNLQIGDVVIGETLYPSADIDDFTLTAPAGAGFQACILNRESYSPDQRIEVFAYTQGTTYTGYANSVFSDTTPQCTSTQRMPATGTARVRVSTQWNIGGPYELRIIGVP